MDADGFRLYFTPLAGVLFTVPSRYCALSVTTSRLSWTVGGPASHRITRVRWYSRWLSRRTERRVRDYHPLWCAVPDASPLPYAHAGWDAPQPTGLTTPAPQHVHVWHGAGLDSSPVRSPLLRAGYYFLQLLRCFSSPRSLPPKRVSWQHQEGLPHSETVGSMRGCRSPTLTPLTGVLHRLVVPRHPPSAHHVLPDHRIARQHRFLRCARYGRCEP